MAQRLDCKMKTLSPIIPGLAAEQDVLHKAATAQNETEIRVLRLFLDAEHQKRAVKAVGKVLSLSLQLNRNQVSEVCVQC